MKHLAVAAAILTTAACTTPPAAPTTCPGAIRQAFAGTGVAERMVKISWRESRWKPTARNPRSSAVGCVQILTRLHRARIARHGYTAADMARAWPNAVVARSLFDDAGLSPWTATA